MNLLISEGGQVLGQTFSPDNAKRHVIVARDKMYTVLKQSDIDNLPLPVMNGLMEEFDVDTSSQKLWNAMKKRPSRAIPYWGKISVQRVIRHLYRDEAPDAAYTKNELLENIPGATWVSITTALTMLKNPKYARGGTIDIRFKDRKYRRVS
jgi:hypothetical protein